MLSILFNANTDPDKVPRKTPDELNPMVKQKKKPMTARAKVFAIGDMLGIPRPEAK